MQKTTLIWFALLALVLGSSGVRVCAQDEKEPAPTKGATSDHNERAKPDASKPIRPYRLDFSLTELDDGKKTNTRHYSMNLTAGSADEIKIGTRVPVKTGPTENSFQYMDVGTRIWATLRESGGEDVQLEVRSETSNIDIPPGHDGSPSWNPIVRQIQINGSSLLVIGKPIVIGIVDDPNSNRQFQLDVTATKLR